LAEFFSTVDSSYRTTNGLEFAFRGLIAEKHRGNA
jgi:hypothetical protein